ncbi:MAG: tetratricopeptide repeat protein [Sporolactobacillus sp.]
MTKSKRTNQKANKVLLFPGLQDRLLQKAMSLVDEKRFSEAQRLFGELLELDPHDQKGLYGWTICSVELGEYHHAEETIVQLMDEGTPFYAEVFRLYLTILIEKRDYKAALREIDQAEKDPDLVRVLNSSLSHLKKFCKLRMDESLSLPFKAGQTSEKKRAQPPASEKLFDWSDLEETDTPGQLLLIRNLAAHLGKSDLPEIQRFLLDENQNSEIKTMLLCAIQEKQLAESVNIWKFGQVYRVVFNDQFLNRAFADQVEDEIQKTLLSEDPTLAGLATDLGRIFTMNIYPKPIEPDNPRVWAAFFAVQAASGDRQSQIMEARKDKFLDLFSVSDEQFQEAKRLADALNGC